MNIKIKRLTLTNFKCFRYKELEFGDDIITIRGRNGAGKTTVFDAILFCLFGKNSQDQTKFDCKTHDDEGNVIPHLDHSVEMVLDIDGKEVTIKHSVKEKWTKKRGESEEVFSGDTHEYFVNGESYTSNDYKKYIASLIDETTFRILTNPQYFPSLKWQEQRAILTKMSGDISDEEIAGGDQNLLDLIAQMNSDNEDIIAYRKHLSYQIKEVRKKLEKIPVRLEEQNKALPEKQDWSQLQTLLYTACKDLKDVDEKIALIKQGNGVDVKRKELHNQINEARYAIEKLRNDAYTQHSDAIAEKSREISKASIKFSEALNNQKLMEQKIQADERLIERCKETDFEAELQKLRDQWPSSKFIIDPQAAFCPTCGQAIPDDQYQEKVEEMRRNFNLNREAKIRELNEKASKIKKDQADAAEELKRLEQELSDDKEKLESIKESINEIFTEKAKLEKEEVKTVEQILSENAEYLTIVNNLKALKEQLESITDSDIDKEKLAEMEATKARLSAETANYQTQLASKFQYDRVLSLIEGINNEEKDLVNQLSELEKKEDVACRYEDRQNELLEERINSHFKITRWKLFRTVVNGGDSYNEPYCECYDLNGTAYHDGLNQAARLNIGLDIINTMCGIYNVSAPVIIDQSESTLNILPTRGQQIRLQVFDSELNIL